MSAAALSLPSGFEAPILKDFSAFIGLRPKSSPSRNISASNESLFKAIAEVSDGLLLQAISEHTSAGFMAKRREVFGNYIKSVVALSEIIDVTIPQTNRTALFEESLTGIESFLKEEALPRFGPIITDQIIFTFWTIQKTHRILAEIAKSERLGEDTKAEDRKLPQDFSLWAWWSLFHLDCVISAIKHDKSIHPGVLDEISDGLRSAVNAYAIAKEGLNLRQAPVLPVTIEPTDWDEEDQELLDDSMRDLEGVSLDNGY
jgi:hypothetical protein